MEKTPSPAGPQPLTQTPEAAARLRAPYPPCCPLTAPFSSSPSPSGSCPAHLARLGHAEQRVLPEELPHLLRHLRHGLAATREPASLPGPAEAEKKAAPLAEGGGETRRNRAGGGGAAMAAGAGLLRAGRRLLGERRAAVGGWGGAEGNGGC